MARSHRYNLGGPLKAGIMSYHPDFQSELFSIPQARAEYARLRREANRRLDVLRRSEFANLKAVTNRPNNYEALPKPGEFPESIDDPDKYVRKKLYEVARFLNLKTSSLKGARESRRLFVESMRKAGYDFINYSNAGAFQHFMNDVTRHFGAKTYDSEQDKIPLFELAMKKRIDPDTLAQDFDFWLKNMNKLEEAPRSNRNISSEEFAKKIGLSID